MRKTIIIFLVSLIAVGCDKDKFTTAPQIEFKSVEPDAVPGGITAVDQGIPILTLKVTDREGDFGDTAYVYIRRIINGRQHYKVDSFYMPDISSIAEKNFSADIKINSFWILLGDSTRNYRPRVDTLTYEIYVKDFAKNKSNVIITDKPIYYVFP